MILKIYPFINIHFFCFLCLSFFNQITSFNFRLRDYAKRTNVEHLPLHRASKALTRLSANWKGPDLEAFRIEPLCDVDLISKWFDIIKLPFKLPKSANQLTITALVETYNGYKLRFKKMTDDKWTFGYKIVANYSDEIVVLSNIGKAFAKYPLHCHINYDTTYLSKSSGHSKTQQTYLREFPKLYYSTFHGSFCLTQLSKNDYDQKLQNFPDLNSTKGFLAFFLFILRQIQILHFSLNENAVYDTLFSSETYANAHNHVNIQNMKMTKSRRYLHDVPFLTNGGSSISKFFNSEEDVYSHVYNQLLRSELKANSNSHVGKNRLFNYWQNMDFCKSLIVIIEAFISTPTHYDGENTFICKRLRSNLQNFKKTPILRHLPVTTTIKQPILFPLIYLLLDGVQFFSNYETWIQLTKFLSTTEYNSEISEEYKTPPRPSTIEKDDMHTPPDAVAKVKYTISLKRLQNPYKNKKKVILEKLNDEEKSPELKERPPVHLGDNTPIIEPKPYISSESSDSSVEFKSNIKKSLCRKKKCKTGTLEIPLKNPPINIDLQLNAMEKDPFEDRPHPSDTFKSPEKHLVRRKSTKRQSIFEEIDSVPVDKIRQMAKRFKNLKEKCANCPPQESSSEESSSAESSSENELTPRTSSADEALR
ncbi:hypothetical protein SNEBB_004279 [Seison nebaliae]|nr:hypothetical protein SNEBB_004279 [Seison nebaliae]